MTVKEAIKKLCRRIEYLERNNIPVDIFYQKLINDLEKVPSYTPMDSPKLKEE